jgi:hypothetical protein
LAKRYNPEIINVDDPGVGGGVVDMLQHEGLPVRGVNTGGSPTRPGNWLNCKADISFNVRDKLLWG